MTESLNSEVGMRKSEMKEYGGRKAEIRGKAGLFAIAYWLLEVGVLKKHRIHFNASWLSSFPAFVL